MDNEAEPAPKPPFEPSQFVEYGDVAHITEAGPGGAPDGSSYS